MIIINATPGQTLTDIAIEKYGCAEGIFILMEDNPILNMDGKLIAGQAVYIRDEVPEITENNKQIVKIFIAQKVNTGIGTAQDNTYVDDGYVAGGFVE